MSPDLRRHAVAPVALALACAACSGPSARFHAGYMQSNLTGDATLAGTAAGIPASARADVETGLGLDDDPGSLYLRAELDAGPVRLTGTAMRYDQSGRGVLDARFGDISAGATVDADVRMGVLKGAATFDVVDVGVFRLSPGVGVDFVDLDAQVTEVATGLGESVAELIPMPMLFVQAEVEVGPVGLVVDFGGMDLTIDDSSGRILDVEGLLLIEPVERVELFAGYRWISVDASGDSGGRRFTADLVLQGWFLGGGVRF